MNSNQDITLRQRFEDVFNQLGVEALAHGRLTIVAATKKQSIDTINAYLSFCKEQGVPAVIGENYVQEFKKKREQLLTYAAAHLIGTLQHNKIREAVRLFDVVESVDSLELINKLQQECDRAQKRLGVYLQVNISRDPHKGGFLPEEVQSAHQVVKGAACLRFEGLMAITKLYDPPEEVRPDFHALRALRDQIGAGGLSMGMSSDFTIAVEEGASCVRIGTALFGERS